VEQVRREIRLAQKDYDDDDQGHDLTPRQRSSGKLRARIPGNKIKTPSELR
jgi:predicted HicB family RNase H-like nuclease